MHRSTAKKLSAQRRKAIPDKLFYKIGEVSKIAGVEPYVLRYWESEFSFLEPRKSKSGQRIYVKKDLELVLTIKNLLYDERYTIEGVRKRFSEGGLSRNPAEPEKKSMTTSDAIELVKSRLREFLEQLD